MVWQTGFFITTIACYKTGQSQQIIADEVVYLNAFNSRRQFTDGQASPQLTWPVFVLGVV